MEAEEGGRSLVVVSAHVEQFVRDAFFFEDEVCQEITQFGREDTDTRSGQDIREPMPIIQYARQADACRPGISRHAVPRAAG